MQLGVVPKIPVRQGPLGIHCLKGEKNTYLIALTKANSKNLAGQSIFPMPLFLFEEELEAMHPTIPDSILKSL